MDAAFGGLRQIENGLPRILPAVVGLCTRFVLIVRQNTMIHRSPKYDDKVIIGDVTSSWRCH
jgi:hypothetical protein